MFERPRTIKVVAMAVLLLLSLMAKPALAVPVTVHGGKVVQLNKRQIELLKQQPAVYYLRTAPDKFFKHYILVELPDELGGGFFLPKKRGSLTSTRVGLCRKTAILMGKHPHSV